MSHDDEFETELTAGREEIAAIVHDVADGIRTGTVRLDDATDVVTVDTPDELTPEIELETETDETSLELELEWPESSGLSPVSSTDVTHEEMGEGADEESTPERAQSLARFEVYRSQAEYHGSPDPWVNAAGLLSNPRDWCVLLTRNSVMW